MRDSATSTDQPDQRRRTRGRYRSVWPNSVMAGMPVMPVVPAEPLEVAEQVVEADAPGDGAERQVVAGQAQRERRRGPARRPRSSASPPAASSHGDQPAGGGQIGRRVGAEADERRLPERGQAADAGQQHEPERDDAGQADVVRQRDRELGSEQRQRPRPPSTSADEEQRGRGSLVLFLSTWCERRRAPQQHRDDEREDDHLLERAGLERRERLEQADEDRARARRADSSPGRR